MDLGLDPITGDLIIEDGMRIVTGVDEIQQRIKVGVTINLNEFFTHTNYGLPWVKNVDDTSDIQYFLNDQDVTIEYITTSIDNFILGMGTVESVTSSYEFDPISRTLSYIPSIVTIEGEEFSYPPYVLEI